MADLKTALYEELVPFYHLLDPLEDHRDEAVEYGDTLIQAVPDAKCLLELGSGAGHGAHFVKTRFQETTLVDLSAAMLQRSERLNPDCVHIQADMRSVNLSRSFDCVLLHDAICYMTTRDDLTKVAKTTFDHLRPGGAALVIPDCTKESFCDYCEDHSADDAERSLRAIMWSHDPDPDDETHVTDFAFLLREKGEVRAVHDRHTYGLFASQVWRKIWSAAGFQVEVIKRPLPDEYKDSAYTDEMFLCRRALTSDADTHRRALGAPHPPNQIPNTRPVHLSASCTLAADRILKLRRRSDTSKLQLSHQRNARSVFVIFLSQLSGSGRLAHLVLMGAHAFTNCTLHPLGSKRGLQCCRRHEPSAGDDRRDSPHGRQHTLRNRRCSSL